MCHYLKRFSLSNFVNVWYKLWRWLFSPMILAKFFGVLGIGFIISGILPCFSFSDKDFFTAGAAMFAASALFYTAHCYLSDKNNKRSEFYISQIQKFFTSVLGYIKADDNSNIRWHQGIDCLITAERLSKKLTEIEHQVIYMTDLINLGYELVSILDSIDSYKFFYGLKDYKDREDSELYAESSGEFLKKKSYQVALKPLIELSAFIDKAARARYDIYYNDTFDENIFLSEYFRVNIVKYKSIHEIIEFNRQKIIFEFIEAIDKESKKS